MSVEETREIIEKLLRAGIARTVDEVGNSDVLAEPVPQTRLAVTKRALRDSFGEEELRDFRDQLAVEVKIGKGRNGVLSTG